MLRGWNVSLIVATFALTILGTFLTRSGVIGSVHAFTESLIGPLFLGFLALVLLVSTALLLWRTPQLHGGGSLDSLLSREAAFLVANLLFVVLTFTVLIGSIFPLVAEAARGTKVSVGAPYFNATTVPVFAAVIFLMGVGPVLPWRRASAEGLVHRFTVPAGFGLLAALFALGLGGRGFWPLLTYGLAGFAAAAMGAEVLRGTLVGVRRGLDPFRALGRLIAGNRRRYGGYIVHTGVLVLAVAVTASWNYKREVEATLAPGESLTVGDYVLRLEDVWAAEAPHRFEVGTSMTLLNGGRPVTLLEPRQNYYPTREDPIPTPTVYSSALQDVFVNLLAFARDGSHATVKVVVTPLMIWIWIGTYIMVAGALVAFYPGRLRRRPARGTGPDPARESEEVRA